ncbi:MAG TPA: lysylphosphatidylglycerol synthase transmembrane domain-containing protein [Phycisphaerae bacterium]|nr:lysylphosphatidylglycerol synthase transmembrane domain-containing protein [Phycisphaerae bacterium]
MFRTKKIWVLLLVAAALLVGVMALVGLEKTWRAVLQAGLPAFLSTGACMLLLVLVQAAAWQYLNGGVGHKVPYHVLLEAMVVGQAGNTLTPSTYLGGEPARVLYVGRRTGLRYQELTGTVLLSKYLEAVSFVGFLLLCAGAAIERFHHMLFEGAGLFLGVTLLIVLALLVTLAVSLVMTLQRGWTPLAAVMLGAERLRFFPTRMRRLRRRTVGVEKQASRVWRQEERLILPAILLYFVTHVVMFVKPLAFFWLGWRLGLDLPELALIFVTSQVLLAFQLTPSGVGTLDGGLIGMLTLAGVRVADPQVAAYLLSLRFWDFVIIALGAFFAARAGAQLLAQPMPGVEEGDEQTDMKDYKDPEDA